MLVSYAATACPDAIITRGLRRMATDLNSSLDADERSAINAWLAGAESDVLILLPHDVIPALVTYIMGKAPKLLSTLQTEIAGLNPPMPSSY